MLTYCSVRVYVSMVDDAKVVDSHWAIVVCSPGLLRIEYRQLHILPIVDNKSVRSF